MACTFFQGAQSSQLGSTEQLTWNRVRIVLQGGEATATSFHIVLPIFFSSTTAQQFEVLAGTVNTASGELALSYALQAPVAGQPTYLTPISVTRPSVSANNVYMGGVSAVIANNVEVAVTSTATFVGTTSNAGLVVVAKWPLFSGAWSSTYQYNGASATNKNSPLSLSYSASSQAYYLSFQPLYSTGAISALSFNWSGVQYPFSSDLPYYNMFMTTSTGTMDCKFEYANAFPSSFYAGPLASFTAACLSQELSTLNTRCQLTFTTNSVVLSNAAFKVLTQGLTIFTTTCALTAGAAVPVTCQSSVDGLTLTITLANSADLPSGTQYTLVIHGVSFTSSFPQMTLQIADSSGTYVLETGQRILPTQPAKTTFIAINSLTLSADNPLALTSLRVNFTTPRLLLDDEQLVL